MKKYLLMLLLLAIPLCLYFYVYDTKNMAKISDLSNEDLFAAIDSEVNHSFMTVDEYVRNTLKINLKNKEISYISELPSENVSGYVIQSGSFFEQFAHQLNMNLDEDDSTYHSDDGLGYFDRFKYKFLAEAEGFYAIPMYILVEGNLTDKVFSYQATSVHDQMSLEVWENYTEVPHYDQETNLTKWLVVFKYPFGQTEFPNRMKVSLILEKA
jgi:hypothetical protein